MTINELIEVLKESGDEKFRNMGKVQIAVDHTWGSEYVPGDRWDVKYGVHGVELHMDATVYEDDDDKESEEKYEDYDSGDSEEDVE